MNELLGTVIKTKPAAWSYEINSSMVAEVNDIDN